MYAGQPRLPAGRGRGGRAMRAHVAGLLGLSVLAAGCAAKPQAELAKISSSDQLTGREIDIYAFPRTYVDLAVPDRDGKIAAVVRQLPYEDFRIAVRPRSALGVRTQVSISKKADSDLIDRAGVEVIDDRAKLVGEVAGIVKGIVSLGSGVLTADFTGAEQPLEELKKFPMTLDTLALMKITPPKDVNPGDPSTWSPHEGLVRYWFGPVSPDAKPVTEGEIAAKRNGLVYAACRELRLRFSIGTARYDYNLFVSDPRYYRFAAFPAKGSIQVHDRCGVSVTSQNPATSSDTAVLLTLINQMNEIKAKLDGLKK